MKPLVAVIFVFVATSVAFTQPKVVALPKDGVVLETRLLPATVRPNRQLVLWMVSPQKNPNGYARDDVYTCPDYTRGSYYSGPLRVSLADSVTGVVLNTVSLKKEYEENADSFDIPYAIRRGYQYQVPAKTKWGVEARPTIMQLRDYNGDGLSLEFALFDAMACMGLQTTLIGYSRARDKVIQYSIALEVVEGAKHSKTTTNWADYVFSTQPKRPGYWQFEVDYRGRGGSLDRWQVRYLPSQERFEAKLVIIPGEN